MQLHTILSRLIKVMLVYLNPTQYCSSCSRFAFTKRSSSLLHSLHWENSLAPECLSPFHFPHAASDSLLPSILFTFSPAWPLIPRQQHYCPLQGTCPDLVLYRFSMWNFWHVPFPWHISHILWAISKLICFDLLWTGFHQFNTPH